MHQLQKAAMATNKKFGTWDEWKAKHPRWHQLLVLELTSIAILLIGLMLLFGAEGWSFWSENRESVRDLMLIIVATVGVPFVIWREYSTHRAAKAAERQAETAAKRHRKQTKADRERRITDSFTKAVELLGKPELEVRLGAIYALERIASESKRDHWPIIETLTAYVRTKSPASPAQVKAQDASRSNQSHSSDEAVSAYAVATAEGIREAEQGTAQAPLTELAVDIQAVLTVLTRRSLEHEEENQRINLRGADLSGADLRGADLSWADLRGADLRGANLREAKLYWADLDRADLRKAKLYRADLRDAALYRADLSWAVLQEADLSCADLSGAIWVETKIGGTKFNRRH
jgi:uncharacterized protein YjbI with pentapeptide repeats